jgi:hypothetical protein
MQIVQPTPIANYDRFLFFSPLTEHFMITVDRRVKALFTSSHSFETKSAKEETEL